MTNVHAAGLPPQQRKPHTIDDHQYLGDVAVCWRCCPEFNLPTVTDEWAEDEADLERIAERLRAL